MRPAAFAISLPSAQTSSSPFSMPGRMRYVILTHLSKGDGSSSRASTVMSRLRRRAGTDRRRMLHVAWVMSHGTREDSRSLGARQHACVVRHDDAAILVVRM